MEVSPSRSGWDSDEAECFYVKSNGKSIVVRRVCFHTQPCLIGMLPLNAALCGDKVCEHCAATRTRRTEGSTHLLICHYFS